MNIQNLPLTQLVPSPANVRKTDRLSGIEQLAASIKAHGLLQNLQVKPNASGQFEVIAGELREKIWARYSCQLQDLLADEQRCAGVDDGDAGSWTIDF